MYIQWFQKDVKFIKDLISIEKQDFLSYQNFKTKYNLNCNFLHYYGLIRAIPKNGLGLCLIKTF